MGVINGIVEGKNSNEIWYICRVVTPEQVNQQANHRPGEPQKCAQGKQPDNSSTPHCCDQSRCPCKQQSRPQCVPRACCQHLCVCGNGVCPCTDKTTVNHNKVGSVENKMDSEDLDLSQISMASGVDERDLTCSKSFNASGMPVTQEDLTEQLAGVQDMVQEMKNGFVTVLGELSKIQYGDQSLQQQWTEHKADYTKQISDLAETVQSLKAEMGAMAEQIKAFAANQKSLEEKLDKVQSERDVLLQEVQRNGKLSQECREKLNIKNGNAVTTPQSDFDSGVNLHQNEGSSGGATTPPQMSPMVKPFMESLQTAHEVKDVEEQYDSDSASVTAVANRSLQLSQTLRAKYAEMNTSGSSDEVEDHNNSSYEEVSPATARENVVGKQYQSSSASESNLHVPLHDHAYNENQRQRIAEEILTSERKYCSTLWTVIDDYVSPLRQMSLMTSRDLNAMFPPYLSQMYAQHCSILRRLEDRVMNWRWNGVVGDIFAKLTDTQEHDLLTLYRDYVNDFPSALSNLNKWRAQSRKFKSFLKNHHHGPGSQGTDVTALLLAPVQRIPRYVLLIKELLKCTDHSHPDRYYLVASLAILRNFLNQLNDEIQHAVQLVAGETSARSRSAASVKSSGSSCDARHGLSARDSGIHSTGEEIVKLHQSPPPRHIVSLRGRQPDREGQEFVDRTPMDSYTRRLRLATSQPNITHSTPPYRADSPYSMAEVAAITSAPRIRERQRRTHNRKTIDSFPMMQSTMPQRTNSPHFMQNSVPRLQLNDYLDDIPEPGSKSYRSAPTQPRPMSVVENRYGEYDMDRLAQLAHNRPHSAAEYMLLQEEQFHADAEAQLQRMLDMQDEYPPRANTGTTRTRNRLSLTPDEEHYGGISVRPNRDRQHGFNSKLASIDHLIDPGLIGRAQQYQRPMSARTQRQVEQNDRDYGIFGDDDEEEEEEDIDDHLQQQPTSLPSDLQPSSTGASGKIMKSKSHGCVVMVVDNGQHDKAEEVDDEPSQEEIASSLAVSLVEKHHTVDLKVPGEEHVNSPISNDARKNLHLQVTAALNGIKEQRITHDSLSQPSHKNKDNESIDSEQNPAVLSAPEAVVTSIPPSSVSSLPRPNSRLATSTPVGSPKKKTREKTKMSFSAALSKSVDDISKKSKKNSIRDSIKNIFNKKKQEKTSVLVCKPSETHELEDDT